MKILDARQHAPATVRNRDAILKVLEDWLPREQGTVLEIASGTGEHGVYFAPRLLHSHWLSSDVDEGRLSSIQAWQVAEPCQRLLPPCHLDVTEQRWPIEDGVEPPIHAIFCANMIHIAPLGALHGLLGGAARVLKPKGRLILYGPFSTRFGHTAPSNAAFDKSLRAQNPDWGIRMLDDVVMMALERRLVHKKTVPMPANNLSLIFEKA